MSNKKLEVKHIAPYFPHDLKLIHIKSGRIITIYGVLNNRIICKESGNWYDLKFYNLKPILRPISDLVNPCLDGGLVPIVEMAKIAFPKNTWHLKFGSAESNTGMYFSYNTRLKSFEIDGTITNSVPDKLKLFEKLFEWHFDVSGLIEKGLAVDINEVKL